MSLPPARVAGAAATKWAPWVLLLTGLVALQLVFGGDDTFPSELDTLFSDPLDRFARWSQRSRRTHWLFTGFFNPLTDVVSWCLESIQSSLLWLPWVVLPLSAGLFVGRTGNWRQGIVTGAAMCYPGLVDLWEVTVETLALMAMAIFISLFIGVPLGVLGAFKPRAESVMRPILDAMQVVPAPVYFVPMLLFFGIGAVPATFATVIYALPPVVRLTTLGIREVPEQAVEASEMFGANRWQTLRKVQLPMAMPTILTGVTQTIMMALGIIVLATLLGAGGLGQEVMDTLTQRRTGRGVATGLAVVSVAMVLDRIGRATIVTDRSRLPKRRVVFGVLGALLALVVVGRVAGWNQFPHITDIKAFDPIDDGVRWTRDNLRWLTRGINDSVVRGFYLPVRDFLTDTIAWPALIFASMWLAWRLRDMAFAFMTGATLLLVGLIGMWELSIDTLTQVVAAVILSILIAVPIGVWAGRHRRVEAALSPLLDALQTIPSLVYIIPAVTLFTIGVVPGIIASVLYAIVPGIRITALGIRQVPEETIEASTMFGATATQTMLGVRVPLAASTILAAINQVIMMVLAMVIISGLVGGGGLGFKTISAVKNSEVGLGFEVGLAIVIMAIILDRMTRSLAEMFRPPAAPHG